MCNTKNGLSKKPLISTQPLKEKKKINEQISVRYQEGNHLDEININYKEKVYDGQFLEFLWIYKTLMITIDLCKKHARVYIFPF